MPRRVETAWPGQGAQALPSRTWLPHAGCRVRPRISRDRAPVARAEPEQRAAAGSAAVARASGVSVAGLLPGAPAPPHGASVAGRLRCRPWASARLGPARPGPPLLRAVRALPCLSRPALSHPTPPAGPGEIMAKVI